MNKDRKVLYILQSVFIAALLPVCFVPKNNYTNLIFAAGILLFSLLFSYLVKKRSILKLEHRQVAVVLPVAAVIIISLYLFCGTGLGFYENPFGAVYLYKYILPFILAVIGAEQIRRVALAQDTKASSVLSYIGLVLFDTLLFSGGNILQNYNGFIDFCSLTLFPAVTANLLYHFISKRYGALPNIVYKVLISVYPYIIPVKPKMSEAMLSFFKILLPVIVLLFVRALYERQRKSVNRKNKTAKTVLGVLAVVLMTGFIMLITCQFRFGLLVIATESMTGSLDKGDAIIYEQYDGQKLSTGQVLVFVSEKRKTVHRIADIEKINGELRIYTKGDANEKNDLGYITTDDIVGISKLKIKYLGYPTVWMRELFNK